MVSLMCAPILALPLLLPPPDPPPLAPLPDLSAMLSPPEPPDPPDPPDSLVESVTSDPLSLFPDLKFVQGLRFPDLDVALFLLVPSGGTLFASLRFFPAVCSLWNEPYQVSRLESLFSSLSLSCLLATTLEGIVSLQSCFILELLVFRWNMLSVLLQFRFEDVIILSRLRHLLPQYEVVMILIKFSLLLPQYEDVTTPIKLSLRLPLYEAVTCKLMPRSTNDFIPLMWLHDFFGAMECSLPLVSSFMEYHFPSNSSFMECVLPSLVFMIREVSFFRSFSMEELALMAIVDARRGQDAQMYHLTTLTFPSTICKEAFKCWLSGAWHAHSPQDERIFQGSPFRPYVFSDFVAEVFGLKTVMFSTKALGVSRLACVSDCQELVILLNSGGHANEFSRLILDISSILLRLISFSCYHVSRVANVLSDSLVNSALLSCNASSFYGV